MLKRSSGNKKAFAISMLLILSIISAGYAQAAENNVVIDRKWIYLTIGMLFVIFGGMIGLMYVLQRKFMKACLQDNQLAFVSQNALGLPAGTVRAVISFIIIAVSLFLCVLLFFKVGGGDRFPEALSSLLGAVVGFYFGSKTGGKGEGEFLQEEVKNLKTDIDKTESARLLGSITKGIDMTKAIINTLPEEQRKKYGNMIGKLEQGYVTVKSLCDSGSVKDAVAKGQDLFNLFKTDNPAKDVVSKALGAFSSALGGVNPAWAVITTVVTAGVKMVGTEYEKWKKRVLSVPLTPAVLPLNTIDDATGFTLLLQSPIFKKIFEQELALNDRAFMTMAANVLTSENVDSFWNTYKGRFESRDQFDRGLQEFRRAALDRELEAATSDRPELLAALKTTTNSLDAINKSEEAKAALHQLVVMIEELQKQGEPVPTIIEKVKKEIEK